MSSEAVGRPKPEYVEYLIDVGTNSPMLERRPLKDVPEPHAARASAPKGTVWFRFCSAGGVHAEMYFVNGREIELVVATQDMSEKSRNHLTGRAHRAGVDVVVLGTNGKYYVVPSSVDIILL